MIHDESILAIARAIQITNQELSNIRKCLEKLIKVLEVNDGESD